MSVVLKHGHRFGERAAARDAPGVGERGIRRQEFCVLADATVETKRLNDRSFAAIIGELKRDARHEKSGLPKSTEQLFGQEACALREDLRVSPVTNAGARHALRNLADHAQFATGDERRERRIGAGACGAIVEDTRFAAMERHRPGLAVTVDLNVEARAQRIDDRRTNTVQTTGCGIRTTAKLAAGVQLGENDLNAAQSGLGLDVDGNAARAVTHLDTAIGVKAQVDLRAEPAQRLVDRVVNDLPEAVHEASRVGRPDVHARTFAHRFETLEYREVAGGVVRAGHVVHRKRVNRPARAPTPGRTNAAHKGEAIGPTRSAKSRRIDTASTQACGAMVSLEDSRRQRRVRGTP